MCKMWSKNRWDCALSVRILKLAITGAHVEEVRWWNIKPPVLPRTGRMCHSFAVFHHQNRTTENVHVSVSSVYIPKVLHRSNMFLRLRFLCLILLGSLRISVRHLKPNAPRRLWLLESLFLAQILSPKGVHP